jgi:hypothetical protein
MKYVERHAPADPDAAARRIVEIRKRSGSRAGTRQRKIILAPTALFRTSVHEATRQQFRFFCNCEAFTSYRRAWAYPIGRSAEIIAAVALGWAMDQGPLFLVDLAIVLAINIVFAVLIYCGLLLWGVLGT